jgi:hypothetical protein
VEEAKIRLLEKEAKDKREAYERSKRRRVDPPADQGNSVAPVTVPFVTPIGDPILPGDLFHQLQAAFAAGKFVVPGTASDPVVSDLLLKLQSLLVIRRICSAANKVAYIGSFLDVALDLWKPTPIQDNQQFIDLCWIIVEEGMGQQTFSEVLLEILTETHVCLFFCQVNLCFPRRLTSTTNFPLPVEFLAQCKS